MAKKALVNPLKPKQYGDEAQTQEGYYIEEISEVEFEVASPLFWIDCPDDTNALLKYYDPADQQIKNIWFEPDPEPIE